MRWVSSLGMNSRLDLCVNQAVRRLQKWTGQGSPDLALAFVSPAFGEQVEELGQRLVEALSPGVLIGATGGGIIGGNKEVEGESALSITCAWMDGVECRGFHLDNRELPDPDAPPDAWRSALGLQPHPDKAPQFVLLCDPFSFDLDALLRGLDYAYPRAVKVGGLASGGESGDNTLFLDGQSFTDGIVGLAMSGNVVLDAVVCQGCRPIGEPLLITKAQGNLVLELSHKPPTHVLQALLEGLGPRDRKLAKTSLFLGLQTDGGFTLESLTAPAPKTAVRRKQKSSEFLVRNLIGVDSVTGALAVGATVRSGQTVQFHLRDAKASARDLERMLERYHRTGARPEGGLMFSCLGRGEHLYGVPNHDYQAFQRKFPGVLLGGFFCNGEIGPVGDSTYLHGYTSCFGLVRPAEEE